MAIYHLTVKAVSRTTGRSAVAAAAYRACVKLTDERTGRVHDYTPRDLVSRALAEKSYIVMPAELGTATWAHDRSTLWNRAEIEAKRKDAKTAREIEFALPAELDEQAASALTRAMGTWLADRFKVAVDVSRHTPSRDGDERNQHVHMQMTTREVTATGFGLRTKQLDDWGSGAIVEIRSRYADLANGFLALAGSPARIDHRSYAAQGSDLLPGIHLGSAATGMERAGIMTEIGDRHRTIQAINAEVLEATTARNAAGQELRAARVIEMREALALDRTPDRTRRPRAVETALPVDLEPVLPPLEQPSPRHASAPRRRAKQRSRKKAGIASPAMEATSRSSSATPAGPATPPAARPMMTRPQPARSLAPAIPPAAVPTIPVSAPRLARAVPAAALPTAVDSTAATPTPVTPNGAPQPSGRPQSGIQTRPLPSVPVSAPAPLQQAPAAVPQLIRPTPKWIYDPPQVYAALGVPTETAFVMLRNGPTNAVSSFNDLIDRQSLDCATVRGGNLRLDLAAFISSLTMVAAEVADRLLVLLRRAAQETRTMSQETHAVAEPTRAVPSPATPHRKPPSTERGR